MCTSMPGNPAIELTSKFDAMSRIPPTVDDVKGTKSSSSSVSSSSLGRFALSAQNLQISLPSSFP